MEISLEGRGVHVLHATHEFDVWIKPVKSACMSDAGQLCKISSVASWKILVCVCMWTQQININFLPIYFLA